MPGAIATGLPTQATSTTRGGRSLCVPFTVLAPPPPTPPAAAGHGYAAPDPNSILASPRRRFDPTRDDPETQDHQARRTRRSLQSTGGTPQGYQCALAKLPKRQEAPSGSRLPTDYHGTCSSPVIYRHLKAARLRVLRPCQGQSPASSHRQRRRSSRSSTGRGVGLPGERLQRREELSHDVVKREA